MASELRVNTINSRSGLGTITVSDTGAVFTGITTIGSVTVDGGTVTGNLTGTASTATASATAYGLSGSPTLTGITSVSTTNLTVNGNAYPATGPLGNRNLIINGAMQVAQRGTQVTGVTAGDYRTCDRFRLAMSSLGTWTVDQDTNAPNGFSHSFKITCTTANASPTGSNNLFITHPIEAYNLQSLGFGTADAKELTLSFWVRSNKTGAATAVLLQTDNSNKLVSFEYSISSADTWEQKVITIPGDTAGVINNDNGPGLQVEWWLNSGSDFTSGSHQATWSTFSNANRNPSNLGVGGATSDYFQITGVQLEVGSVATPFEYRSYADELARCERYYQKYGPIQGIPMHNYNTSNGVGGFPLRVTMRGNPTADKLAAYNDASVSYYSGSATAKTLTALVLNYARPNFIALRVGSSSAFTAGYAGHLDMPIDDALSLSAEL